MDCPGAVRLQRDGNGVDAEAVNTSCQPKAENVEHRCPHLRISPIQVRLLSEIGMIIVLAAGLVEGPSWSAEFADPIVGRSAVGPRIAPDIPVALCVRP